MFLTSFPLVTFETQNSWTPTLSVWRRGRTPLRVNLHLQVMIWLQNVIPKLGIKFLATYYASSYVNMSHENFYHEWEFKLLWKRISGLFAFWCFECFQTKKFLFENNLTFWHQRSSWLISNKFLSLMHFCYDKKLPN